MNNLEKIWMFVPQKYRKKFTLLVIVLCLVGCLVFMIGYYQGLSYGIDHCNTFWLNQTKNTFSLGSTTTASLQGWK